MRDQESGSKFLCSKCLKREATVKIYGKTLCSHCVKTEVLGRLGRNLLVNSMLKPGDKLGLVELPWISGVNEVLEDYLSRVSSRIRISYERIDVHDIKEDLNEALHGSVSASTEFGKELGYDVISLPLTSDFFLAYLVRSLIEDEGPYLGLYAPKLIANGIRLILPFFNISTIELSIIRRCEISFPDPILTSTLTWMQENLKLNLDFLRSFERSIEAFRKPNRCTRCCAFVEGELCNRCKVRSIRSQ